jgi:hypothetical protein
VPCGLIPQTKMDATAAAARRLLLPLRPAPSRPGAVALCSWRRRPGPRRRVWAAPAGASLDRAAVLLDAAAAVSAGGTGYSQASYYTSLGMFVLSVPGLWSLIKRSVKSKVLPVPSASHSTPCQPCSLLGPAAGRARALAGVATKRVVPRAFVA